MDNNETRGRGVDLDLTDLDQAFDEAPDGTIPDSEYETTVETMDLRTSNAGNRMLEWKLRVDGPTCQGEQEGLNTTRAPSSASSETGFTS